MPALIISLLALLFVLWLLGQPYLTERRRQKIRVQPFPVAWRAVLQQRVPYVDALPADLQRQLQQHIQVFLAEKAFIGCDDLEITDEMRAVIGNIRRRASAHTPQTRSSTTSGPPGPSRSQLRRPTNCDRTPIDIVKFDSAIGIWPRIPKPGRSQGANAV